jgi:hypothetical protein
VPLADVDFQAPFTFLDCLMTIKTWWTRIGHLPIAVLVGAKDDATPDVLGVGRHPCRSTAQFDAPTRSPVDLPPRSSSRRTTAARLRRSGTPYSGSVGRRSAARNRRVHARQQRRLSERLPRRPSVARRSGALRSASSDDAAFQADGSVGDQAEITARVAAGYVIGPRRRRHQEARVNDTSTRDAALASGAQWVSTDYPVPNPDFGTGYSVEIPDGHPARCNPVNAPYGCRSVALE